MLILKRAKRTNYKAKQPNEDLQKESKREERSRLETVEIQVQ